MMSYNRDDFHSTINTIFYKRWYVVADVICSYLGSIFNSRFEAIETWWDKVRYKTYVNLYRRKPWSTEFDGIVIFVKNQGVLRLFDHMMFSKQLECRNVFGCTDISLRYGSNRNASGREYNAARECMKKKTDVWIADIVIKKNKYFLQAKPYFKGEVVTWEIPDYLLSHTPLKATA